MRPVPAVHTVASPASEALKTFKAATGAPRSEIGGGKVASPGGEALKSLKAATGSPDRRSGAVWRYGE